MEVPTNRKSTCGTLIKSCNKIMCRTCLSPTIVFNRHHCADEARPTIEIDGEVEPEPGGGGT